MTRPPRTKAVRTERKTMPKALRTVRDWFTRVWILFFHVPKFTSQSVKTKRWKNDQDFDNSYIIIEHAEATFNDSPLPNLGIESIWSHWLITSGCSPCASPPNTNIHGFGIPQQKLVAPVQVSLIGCLLSWCWFMESCHLSALSQNVYKTTCYFGFL